MNEKSYNRIADQFSLSRKNCLWPEFEIFKNYLLSLKRKRSTSTPLNILDVGCGSGRLLQFLRHQKIKCRYFGLDSSEKLLLLAKKNYENTKNTTFTKGNILNLPYKDNQFDLVFAIAVLHHIPSEDLQMKAVREISRVLKTKGLFFMTNWNLWRLSYSQKTAWNSLFKKWISHNGSNIPLYNIEHSGKLKMKSLFDVITYFGCKKQPLFYHAFTRHELKKIFKKINFTIIKNCYIKDGRSTWWWNGKNILTIVKKQRDA